MTVPADPASRAEPGVALRLERPVGAGVREARLLGVQHRCGHYRVTLTDGRVVFAKAAADNLGGIVEAEGRGLRWLPTRARSRFHACSAATSQVATTP